MQRNRFPYDINSEIPVKIIVHPQDADTSMFEYVSDSSDITFEDGMITAGTEEGGYKVYITAGAVRSDILSVTIGKEIEEAFAAAAESESEQESKAKVEKESEQETIILSENDPKTATDIQTEDTDQQKDVSEKVKVLEEQKAAEAAAKALADQQAAEAYSVQIAPKQKKRPYGNCW